MRNDRQFTQALSRHWRPALAVFALAVVAGQMKSWVTPPEYRARATVWVKAGAAPLGDYLRSAHVVDSAVRTHALYLEADSAAQAVTRGFALQERFMPGKYRLSIDAEGARWVLTRDDENVGGTRTVADNGFVGDSSALYGSSE